MPIQFRCTGCRSKLYGPARWHGTSIVCPRCETRVMVPAGAAGGVVTSFEGAAIEASLEALLPTADGPYDATPFAVKVGGKVGGKSRRKGKRPPRPPAVGRPRMVTLPAWAPYAWSMASLLLAGGAFWAGVLWASRGGGS